MIRIGIVPAGGKQSNANLINLTEYRARIACRGTANHWCNFEVMHTRWFSSWNYRDAYGLRLHATRRAFEGKPEEYLVARNPQTTSKHYFRYGRSLLSVRVSISTVAERNFFRETSRGPRVTPSTRNPSFFRAS